MDILLDVHTHTIASGHAFSSLQEMAKSAAEKRLRLLGITEHTPGIPGTDLFQEFACRSPENVWRRVAVRCGNQYRRL